MRFSWFCQDLVFIGCDSVQSGNWMFDSRSIQHLYDLYCSLFTNYCQIIKLLTVLPVMTIGVPLFKKLPAFYGVRSFIIAFTGTRHLPLTLARWIRSTPSCPLHPFAIKLFLLNSNSLMQNKFSITYFFIIKPTRCTNFPNLLRHETLHVSGSSSAHHHIFIHCTLSNGICHTGL